MKRSPLLVGATAVALALVAGCGTDEGTASSGGSGGGEGGTVKVGVVLPFSGVQAAIARFEGIGAEVAAKQINDAGGIAGKWKIELVQKDDQLDAARSGSVVRELSSEGVSLAMGGQTTTLCQSLAEATAGAEIAFFGAHCTSKKLIDPPVTDNFWMVSAKDVDLTKALGSYISEEFPDVDQWSVFAYDQEVTRGFWTQTAAEISAQTGNDITAKQEFYVPVGETNYRNQLSSLLSGSQGAKDNSGLFLGVYGAGTTSFIQQAKPLGLLDAYAVIAQTGVYWTTAKALEGTAPSIHNVHEYFWSCQDNEMNKKFVADFEALAGEKPDTGAYQSYVTLNLIAAAIEKADSIDQAAVQEALPGLSIDTPTGLELTMDGDSHHANQPITVANLYGDPSAPQTVGIRDCKTVLADEL